MKSENTLIKVLKGLTIAIMVWMGYIVVSTSMESNLFEEWHTLGGIPWMRATLWDFYANVLVIYLWVCYKERTLAQRIIWLILLCCLGSIATAAYVFIQLFKLKPGEGLKELLSKRHPHAEF
jgi:uncharacterized membrane protein YczE